MRTVSLTTRASWRMGADSVVWLAMAIFNRSYAMYAPDCNAEDAKSRGYNSFGLCSRCRATVFLRQLELARRQQRARTPCQAAAEISPLDPRQRARARATAINVSQHHECGNL
eukprot:6186593-Pleurochrysis_carterae.AAC.2